MSVQWRRVRVAAFALVLLIAGVLVIDSVRGSGEVGVVDEALALSGAIDSGEGPAAVPDGFGEEVMSLEGCTDIRVGANGLVVGFSIEGAPEATFQNIVKAMEDRGWRAVPSGSAAGGSFVKQEGRYSWVLITCVGMGSSTSVVVQCSVKEKESGL